MKAVIFDLDGVIADTESVRFKLLQHEMQQEGITLNDDKKYGLVGINTIDFLLRYYSHALSEKKALDIRNRVISQYRKSNVKPVDGVLDVIDYFEQSGMKLAVATGASRFSAERVLNILEIFEKFSAIVTADDVIRRKPFPDTYLLAAKRLAIDPKDALAIEDSAVGINAAKQAGLRCIGITTTQKKQDLSQADYVIDRFKDIFNLPFI